MSITRVTKGSQFAVGDMVRMKQLPGEAAHNPVVLRVVDIWHIAMAQDFPGAMPPYYRIDATNGLELAIMAEKYFERV